VDTNRHEEAMVAVAWMYYDDGLTHEAIARKLRMSRVAVTRLLQQARREGLVQVKVTKPRPVQYDLARRLTNAFGLKHALVVRTRGTLDETLDDIGAAGADHVLDIISPGCRLGVGWSTTVSRVGPRLRGLTQPVACVVNELIGSWAGHSNPYSVSWQIAQVLGAPVETLPVPVLVHSAETREALLKEPAVRRSFAHARQCDLALVGLGDVEPGCTLVKTGYMTADQIVAIRGQGAVGDVLCRYYDIEGRHIPVPLENYFISLTWDDILRIPHTVALAAGPTKATVILGALRGRVCHDLITDTETAQRVLELAGEG
jgi:lsr operon transcriptional repressor